MTEFLKKQIFFLTLMLFTSILFAQENKLIEFSEQQSQNGQSSVDGIAEKKYFAFLEFGPMLLLNTDGSKSSAPSPIMYSAGFGADCFVTSSLFFEPKLSFFTNYYQYDGNKAQPAEVENRTASVLSFMVDLTFGKIWQISQHEISFTAGSGFLARFAMLSGGVSEDSAGSNESRTASDDVKDINSFFWSDLHFLYPELSFSYLYRITDRARAGFDFRVYLPFGSLISDFSLDEMIFSLSAKIKF